MTDNRTNIDAIRAEIDQLPPEHRILARYVEALHADQMEKIADMQAAFDAARLGTRVLMWLSLFGGGIAAMWAGFHGKPL